MRFLRASSGARSGSPSAAPARPEYRVRKTDPSGDAVRQAGTTQRAHRTRPACRAARGFHAHGHLPLRPGTSPGGAHVRRGSQVQSGSWAGASRDRFRRRSRGVPIDCRTSSQDLCPLRIEDLRRAGFEVHEVAVLIELHVVMLTPAVTGDRPPVTCQVSSMTSGARSARHLMYFEARPPQVLDPVKDKILGKTCLQSIGTLLIAPESIPRSSSPPSRFGPAFHVGRARRLDWYLAAKADAHARGSRGLRGKPVGSMCSLMVRPCAPRHRKVVLF